jgi:hypothetical protein
MRLFFCLLALAGTSCIKTHPKPLPEPAPKTSALFAATGGAGLSMVACYHDGHFAKQTSECLPLIPIGSQVSSGSQQATIASTGVVTNQIFSKTTGLLVSQQVDQLPSVSFLWPASAAASFFVDPYLSEFREPTVSAAERSALQGLLPARARGEALLVAQSLSVDVDGDKKLDTLYLAQTDSSAEESFIGVLWAPNQETSAMRLMLDFESGNSTWIDSASDLNQDGRAELLISHRAGDGGFWIEAYSFDGVSFKDITAASDSFVDVDGDGVKDQE